MDICYWSDVPLCVQRNQETAWATRWKADAQERWDREEHQARRREKVSSIGAQLRSSRARARERWEAGAGSSWDEGSLREVIWLLWSRLTTDHCRSISMPSACKGNVRAKQLLRPMRKRMLYDGTRNAG